MIVLLYWFKCTRVLLFRESRSDMVDLLQKPEMGWKEDICIALESKYNQVCWVIKNTKLCPEKLWSIYSNAINQ
jgi:hypothetical protein